MHTLNLINITEHRLEHRLEDQLENQLMYMNNIYINTINNLWIYLIPLYAILTVMSCFFPGFLCKTIRNIPCIIWRFITCFMCKRTKPLINRFDPRTLRDIQLLISPLKYT